MRSRQISDRAGDNSTPSGTWPPPAEGTVWDQRYRVEATLGAGAGGVVFKARHIHLYRPVAVKLLRSSLPEERFRREAEALGRLKHANIVDILDYGIETSSHQPYLVLEYLEGVTLDADGRPAADTSTRLDWLEGIAAAIDFAHSNGVLHRDLKPANVVLVAGAGGRWTPKVLDFGLARLARETEVLAERMAPATSGDDSARLTDGRALIGTPAYVAPEQIDGPKGDRPADIYSFGVLAYELLAGRPPFEGSVAEVLAAHAHRAPPDPRSFRPDLAPELATALLAPLAKDPSLRPSTARAVVEDLRQAFAAAGERTARPILRRRRSRAAAAVAALSFLAGAAMLRLPLVARWEARTWDLRFGVLPGRSPDARLVLLSVDDESLRRNPEALSARGDEIGRLLAQALDAGAAAVAVDFLLPRQWGQAAGFSELVVRHHERLTLAAWSSPEGRVVGPECLSDFARGALGDARAATLFGFVNVDVQPDAVVRTGRQAFADQTGAQRASWAARAAETLATTRGRGASGGVFLLDGAMRWRELPRLPWHAVEAKLATEPGLFRGKLVLLGGDFGGSGDDYHLIPAGADAQPVSGLVLQAQLVDSILAGPIRPRTGAPWIVAPALAAAAMLAAGLASRAGRAAAFALGVGGGYTLAAVWALAYGRTMWPLAAPLATLLLGCGAGLLGERVLGLKHGRQTGFP